MPDVPLPTVEDLLRNLMADWTTCANATPGPWRAQRDALGHWRILWPHSVNGSIARNDKVYGDDDIAFIVAARVALPAAIRRALWAEGYVAELKARLNRLERLVAACNHDSDGLPGRVREAYEALDD